jgi:hypothetical protein
MIEGLIQALNGKEKTIPKTNEELKPSECEACGAGQVIAEEDIIEEPEQESVIQPVIPQVVHGPDCIKDLTPDGSCICMAPQASGISTSVLGRSKVLKLIKKETKPEPINLTLLNYHGRKLWLCDGCYDKEKLLIKNGEKNLHEYQKNVPDRIEVLVDITIRRETTIEKYQELYSKERPHWVLANFESIEDMRNQLVEFITSMERLEWETKTKKRVAYDAARELDTRLSREEREKLINDPTFKVPTNSEYKKIQKDREMDEVIKTLYGAAASKVTAKQKSAIKSLLDFGLSIEEIKAQLKI